MPPVSPHLSLESIRGVIVLRLQSRDGTNRLTKACVLALTEAFHELARSAEAIIITGNSKFFSAGADLEEIGELTGPAAFEFAKMGQALMSAIEQFPAPTYAAIEGYCMGGGLDLAIACRHRIASPHAMFGHRGAALGLITGWGGTQRLSRLLGKASALAMFLPAAKLSVAEALQTGLIEAIADDPVTEAIRCIGTRYLPATNR